MFALKQQLNLQSERVDLDHALEQANSKQISELIIS